MFWPLADALQLIVAVSPLTSTLSIFALEAISSSSFFCSGSLSTVS